MTTALTREKLAASLKLLGFTVEKEHRHGYRYRVQYKKHTALLLARCVFIDSKLMTNSDVEISFTDFYKRAVKLVENAKDAKPRQIK